MHVATSGSAGLLQLKGVAPWVVPASWTAQVDGNGDGGSRRVPTAPSLESISEHKERLKIRWRVNSELLACLPKRAKPDGLVLLSAGRQTHLRVIS